MITDDKFLLYAKRILSQKSIQEEELRTAISRAYYSLYHTTSSVMRKKYSIQLINEIRRNYPKKKIDLAKLNRLDKKYLSGFNLHRILFFTLLNLGFITEAFQFKDFRSKRNEADYDLALNFTQADSITIVNEVEKLMTALKNI